MSSSPIVKIDDLVNALQRVLAEVAVQHGAEVQLLNDYYWVVPTEAAFAMENEPVDFTVGQLTDDAESVRQFLDSPSDGWISIWPELAHIAGVLRGIEELDRRSIQGRST